MKFSLEATKQLNKILKEVEELIKKHAIIVAGEEDHGYVTEEDVKEAWGRLQD